LGIEHPVLGLMTATIILTILVGAVTFMAIYQRNVQEDILRTPYTESYALCFTEQSQGGGYRYLATITVANSGGSDLKLEKLYISTDTGILEVTITSPTTTATIGDLNVKVTLRGFAGVELWRGMKGYVDVEITSPTRIYTSGRIYSIAAYFKTLGFDGFTVAEGRFKVGEIENCIITPPILPPTIPLTAYTPFTWQLREYKAFGGGVDMRFEISRDNLRIVSISDRVGVGYVFRYLPRDLLEGNRILVRVRGDAPPKDDVYVGVYVVDSFLLNRRDSSYILVDRRGVNPWRGILQSITIARVQIDGTMTLLIESSPLNLGGFRDWVTLVIALEDLKKSKKTVTLDIYWVAVVDQSGRTLVNLTFRDTSVLMELSGTERDYGIVDFNQTRIEWSASTLFSLGGIVVTDLQPGWFAVIRNAIGGILASGIAGDDEVAFLEVTPGFVARDVTVEVYDSNGVLVASRPFPEVRDGDIYIVRTA